MRTESETFRKWLVERGCRIESGKDTIGVHGHPRVTVHLKDRKAVLPEVGTKKTLDQRIVRKIVSDLGLNWDELPGPCASQAIFRESVACVQRYSAVFFPRRAARIHEFCPSVSEACLPAIPPSSELVRAEGAGWSAGDARRRLRRDHRRADRRRGQLSQRAGGRRVERLHGSNELLPNAAEAGGLAGYFTQVFAVADAEVRKLRHDPSELFTRALQPGSGLLFGEVMARCAIARRRSRDRSECFAIFPVTPAVSPFQPPPHRSRRRGRRVPLERLSHRQSGPLEDDAASPARVHPALSAARAAHGLPPLLPLRALRQRQPRRQHRDGPAHSWMSPSPAADPQQHSPSRRSGSRRDRRRARRRCRAEPGPRLTPALGGDLHHFADPFQSIVTNGSAGQQTLGRVEGTIGRSDEIMERVTMPEPNLDEIPF